MSVPGAYACGEQRPALVVTPFYHPYYLRQGLAGLGACQVHETDWLVSPRDLPSSASEACHHARFPIRVLVIKDVVSTYV